MKNAKLCRMCIIWDFDGHHDTLWKLFQADLNEGFVENLQKSINLKFFFEK